MAVKDKKTLKPTPAELPILAILWEEGPSTVRHVHDIVMERQKVGYTTILKFLQIMHKKGLVKRDSSAMAHIYEPAFSEEEIQRRLLNDLVQGAFKGSAKNLVLSALAMEESSAEELAEIKSMISELEGK